MIIKIVKNVLFIALMIVIAVYIKYNLNKNDYVRGDLGKIKNKEENEECIRDNDGIKVEISKEKIKLK